MNRQVEEVGPPVGDETPVRGKAPRSLSPPPLSLLREESRDFASEVSSARFIPAATTWRYPDDTPSCYQGQDMPHKPWSGIECNGAKSNRERLF